MDPYVGEIRMFGGNFAPDGWALCNGQLLSIADNIALYSLIGTTYGGDGISNFALPDLQVVIDYEPSVVLTLALICSAFTADYLRTVGFTRVLNLKGGSLDWVDKVDPSQPKY